MFRALFALGGLIACVTAGLGCQGDQAPTFLLAVRSEGRLESLEIWSKRYLEDGAVILFSPFERTLSASRVGYTLSEGGEPLRVRVDLVEPGRYAIHLIGVLEGTGGAERPTLLATTVCGEAGDAWVEQEAFLSLLTPALDADGDSFPDDLEAFCTARFASGLPCDETCQGVDYRALIDCNPGEGFVVPPGCGEVPPSELWHPFVLDACGDCINQDCWGGDATCEDGDGDGFPQGADCDDGDPAINPAAQEICGNDVDENCSVELPACSDGALPCDGDGDGFFALRPALPGCGSDCDDTDPAINPDAFEGFDSDPEDPESYPGCGDGVDNNCNGRVDERCVNDLDSDGVERDRDCDDCNSAVGPGFVEVCGDEVDQDCDGADTACVGDADRDGSLAEPEGRDCDDTDPRTFLGAPDRCGDGVAQDCVRDVPCAEITDVDGDGFAAGFGDCDDDSIERNPWARELCDGAGEDEDCDGQVNEVDGEGALEGGCGFDQGAGSWFEITFSDDIDHCGGCHHACDRGLCYREGDECQAGRCICSGGPGCAGDVNSYCCSEGCVDISADPDHCGSCDSACANGEGCRPTGSCGRGQCFCAHEDDEAPCDLTVDNACCPGVGCTNTRTDPDNCGSCGVDCSEGDHPRGNRCDVARGGCVCGSSGEVCTGSTWCTVVTEPEGERCGCRNLDGDPDNCGACGFACDENEECVAGRCRCRGYTTDCAGTQASFCCLGAGCVDLEDNVAHCGGCSQRCAPGETCVDGDCRCQGGPSCDPATERCCGGSCYTTLTDANHCGPLSSSSSCSTSCGEGESCVDGDCTCEGSCDDGDSCTEDACEDGRCVHRTNDLDDDGWCELGCLDAASGDQRPGDCLSGDGDCDDLEPAINPGAVESCATADDDDCSGTPNDLNALGCTLFYLDVDDDTYGAEPGVTQCLCTPSGSYSATRAGDCADANLAVNPGALELCNNLDDDCSPGTPDGVAQCSGALPYCCSVDRVCGECCVDAHCAGGMAACIGHECIFL